MVVFNEMRRAIEAAAADRLATVASAMAQAFGAGGLTDAQYEELDGLLAARRRVAQAAPPRAQQLQVVAAQLVPAADPTPERGEAAPGRTHPRTGSRPRSADSMARRRRWAAAGYLPPKLAAVFTPGEQAVLAVVGRELATKGYCTLAQGNIAALAGVSVDTAKRALRQAALVGLVAIEVRRLTGYRNDTNRITLASCEWASWLRLRLPRSARPDLGGGGQFAAGTDNGASSRRTQSRGSMTIARASSPVWPPARAAGA